MSKNNAFMSVFQQAGSEAAIRVASKQLSSGLQKAVVTSLQKKGMDKPMIESVAAFLDTEFGRGLFALALGYGLPHVPVPQIQNHPQMARVTNELTVNGMSAIGNAVFDEILGNLLPVITSTLETLPTEGTDVTDATDATSEENEDVSFVENNSEGVVKG